MLVNNMRGTDVQNITCYVWEMAKSKIEIFHFQKWHLANKQTRKLGSSGSQTFLMFVMIQQDLGIEEQTF